MTTLKGRVIEIWFEQDKIFLEIIERSDRHVVETRQVELARNLVRGDVVKAHVDDSLHLIRIDRVGGPSLTEDQTSRGAWCSTGDSMRWRRNLTGPSRMARLWQRQEILSAIREDLQKEGYLEVETPLWVKGTTPDGHIESVQVGAQGAGASGNRDPGDEDRGYLVTSTEYQIKRLMVGGFEKVFTLTRNFRASDRGRFHSNEFTMLEWARAFGTLEEIEEDAIRFIRKSFRRLYPNQTALKWEGTEIDFMISPWERLTVREAFKKYLKMENLEDFSKEALLRSAHLALIELPADVVPDQHYILSYLLDRIQPYLGKKVPCFLREWPLFMTSSARPSLQDPYAAERSEIYIAGVEISDGFPFLDSIQKQREYFCRELERRSEDGKPQVILDQAYLKALEEGIPPGAGMALGIDRLVMVLTGASQLADVQAFSWDEI